MKNGFTMNTQKYKSLNGWCYEAMDLSISQNIFSYLKTFSMQRRYTNINTYIICDENDSK